MKLTSHTGVTELNKGDSLASEHTMYHGIENRINTILTDDTQEFVDLIFIQKLDLFINCHVRHCLPLIRFGAIFICFLYVSVKACRSGGGCV